MAGEKFPLAMEVGRLCSDRVFDEKWLVAPSLRAGYQLLDSAAAVGFPVVNVHVKTFRRVALELAMPVMSDNGRRFLSGTAQKVFTTFVLSLVGGNFKGRGYLISDNFSMALAELVASTVEEMRLAEIVSEDVKRAGGGFEVSKKAREIEAIVRSYEKMLEVTGYADYADVVRMALGTIDKGGEERLPFFIALGEVVGHLTPLEQRLWDAIPQRRRCVVGAGVKTTELATAGWGQSLSAMAEVCIDGCKKYGRRIEIRKAAGEVNEIREVLRYCMEKSIAFDDVEVVYTDSESYLPIAYEELCCMSAGGDIPATFSEGIPVRYSRAVRAINSFVSWVDGGFLRGELQNAIAEGVFNIEGVDDGQITFGYLSSLMNSVPVFRGKYNYIPAIEERIRQLMQTEGGSVLNRVENHSDISQLLEKQIRGLEILKRFVGRLVEVAPSSIDELHSDPLRAIDVVKALLCDFVTSRDRVDEYARHFMIRKVEEIEEFISCMDVGGYGNGSFHKFFSVVEWLQLLGGRLHVDAKGPAPGCIYFTPVSGGGYSGRRYVFVIGVDENRFPPAAYPDPVLLDNERRKLGGKMRPSCLKMFRNLASYHEFFRRVEASNLIFTTSCMELKEGREVGEGIFLKNLRQLLDGGCQDGRICTFAPVNKSSCYDISSYFLWAILRNRGRKRRVVEAMASRFVHLGWGMEARAKRGLNTITEYDGFIGAQKGLFERCNPFSPAKLRLFIDNPLDFFIRYLLRVIPPEEVRFTPNRWLEPEERGFVLHSIFRQFMERAVENGMVEQLMRNGPCERTWLLLKRVFESNIAEVKRCKVPVDSSIFGMETRQMWKCCEIFLKDQSRLFGGNRPIMFEVVFGSFREGGDLMEGSGQEVSVRVRSGKFLFHGYIDRVDKRRNGFVVIDYKTGKSGRIAKELFKQLQPYIYKRAAAKILASSYKKPRIEDFCFYFPSTAEQGHVVAITGQEFEDYERYLEELLNISATMIKAGLFPPSENTEAMSYSDYANAHFVTYGRFDLLRRVVAVKAGNEPVLRKYMIHAHGKKF